MAHYAEIEPDKALVAFHEKSLAGFSAQEIEAARKLLVEVFIRMERRLKDHAYLVGEEQSLADIAWLPQYVLLSMLGFDFRPYPGIVAWAMRQQQRPAYRGAIAIWMPKIPGWIVHSGMKVMRLFRRLKAA